MSVERPLAGKVAVVTGAGRGLGRAMALALAGAGAEVALAARSEDQLRAVAKEIEVLGSRGLAVPTDITDAVDVDALARRTVKEFGRVDILVNNSGIVASTPLLEQSTEEWDAVQATNVRGTFLTTRAVGRYLVEQGAGKVINIASTFAFQGVARHAAYCSSKAAVVAFTRSVAIEWARYNIQVNALAPGYFATDLNAGLRADEAVLTRITKAIPARRIGEPDELAPWLLLLAGPASDFMTGETVVIDGGQAAH